MRKKDFVLIGIVLLMAVILGGVYYMTPEKEQAKLRITVDGEEYGVYDLSENRSIEINDTNVCVIQNGRVTMTEADCPDHLCMQQKAIDSRGGTIVCLPNKVVLEIISTDSDEEAPDVISS